MTRDTPSVGGGQKANLVLWMFMTISIGLFYIRRCTVFALVFACCYSAFEFGRGVNSSFTTSCYYALSCTSCMSELFCASVIFIKRSLPSTYFLKIEPSEEALPQIKTADERIFNDIRRKSFIYR